MFEPAQRRVITVDDLWQGYRPRSQKGWRRDEVKWALRRISFDVREGELLGVIGHNGSGKSTLLKCLAGILKPLRGRVETTGRVASLIDLGAGFHRELTGRENLVVVGAVNGLTRKQVRERVDAIRDFSGLSEEEISAPVLSYSSGMMLRLGFSLAVYSDPEILLLDEVMAVGDESFKEKCIAKISFLLENGCGGVLVSHQLDLVTARCERVLVLHEGSICFSGDAAEAVAFYLDVTKGSPDEQDLSEGALFGSKLW